MNTASTIRRTLTLALFALLAVILIAVARTASLDRRDIDVAPAQPIDLDLLQATSRLSKAITFVTIARTEGPDYAAKAAFRDLHAYLSASFPRVHSTLTRESVNDFSALYTWPGRNSELKPALFAAHLDVVPVEPGTEDAWKHPAFDGKVSDQFIWGRGALDDKQSVLGLLEAVEALLAEGFSPERTLYLAFGHDEEVGGHRGAAAIAALLEQRGVRLEFVLDEGLVITTGIVPGIQAPVAAIGIAEKGFANIQITARAEGGHSSMPSADIAIAKLAAAIDRLNSNPMPAEIRPPLAHMLESIAPDMPPLMRAALANLWLTKSIVLDRLASSPAANAQIRTTIAPTILEAGTKANVLPQSASAIVNVRTLPGDSIRAVVEHLHRAIADANVAIELIESAKREASNVSDPRSASYRALEQTVAQVFPQTLVVPGLMTAGTDGRHYARITDDIFRFMPLRLTQADLARFHGTNERLSIENYGELIQFYAQLMRNSAGHGLNGID